MGSFLGGESIVSYGRIDPAGNTLKEKQDSRRMWDVIIIR